MQTNGVQMKKFLQALIPLTLLSCTSVKHDQKLLAWEEWKGLPTSALEKHGYFKQLPVEKLKHEDGLETWFLRDQARFQTSAYCQSLGGCIGMPTYFCDNVFSVKNGIIMGFEQNGSCPGIKTIEAPKK